MKKSLISLIILTNALSAAPGCLDNSYHLTQLFDHKNYHHVSCNCPCEKQYKILAKRAQCSKCLHYRDPYHTNSHISCKRSPFCLVKTVIESTPCPIGYSKQIMKKL